MIAPNGTPAAPLWAVAEELARGGVRDVVICPGSRSTPLALALRASPDLRCWVHLDERVGGFFALGAAKANRRPVAILVTSGTAAAELMPAMVEASLGRVPLIAVTADRPPEARDRGANQTIDQDHLYGRFARWYAELPLPADDAVTKAHVRSVVARAVAMATAAPAGPVHLNAPFREPLVPSGQSAAAGEAEPVYTTALVAPRTLPERAMDELAATLASAPRGVIVCGPLDEPGFGPAVAALAAATGYPVLADVLSNVRLGPHDRAAVISHAGLLVRSARFVEEHRPEVVLRFGGTPVSRPLLEWIAAGTARQVVVDDGGWTEPTLLPVTMVQAEPVSLARTLAPRVADMRAARASDSPPAPDGWLDGWLAADDEVARTVDRWIASLDEPFEGQVFRRLGDALPDGALLLAGNSMPVRDADAFLRSGPQAMRCLGNRGASGIDGLVSTALGAAAAGEGPVVAVVGDLSLLHDLGGLVAGRRLGLSLAVVLVDNDGGGIFSLLPQADAQRPEVGLPEHFEELFGTPHGLDLGPVVTALGAGHRHLEPRDLPAALAATLGKPGCHVLHVRTDRARNAALHRELGAMVEQALEAHLAGDRRT